MSLSQGEVNWIWLLFRALDLPSSQWILISSAFIRLTLSPDSTARIPDMA